MLKIGSHMDVRRSNGMGIRGATSYHSAASFRGGDSQLKSPDLRPTTNIPLARSGTVSTGLMVKQAQQSSGTTFTPPGFYSPYHTPSSWQVPTNRHEVYRWCLHPETLVTMSDFTQKSISQIEVGDSVLTSEGTPGLVTVTSTKSYEGDLKSIEVVGIPGAIKATPDHIFYRVKEESLSCKYFKGQFRYCRQKHACTAKNCSDHEDLADKLEIEECRADELREGDFLYSPTDVLHGERRDYSPEFMRMIGYYLAEGGVSFRADGVPKDVLFSFGKGEIDGIVEDCVQIIRDEFDYEAGIQNKETAHVIAIYSKDIAEQFIKLCGTGSSNKRISPELLAQAPNLLKELALGYFLGDGGKVPSGESAFTSVNYDLLSQIKLILEGLGVASRLSGEKELGDHEVGHYHKLHVSGIEANALFLESSYQNYKTAQVERRQNNLRSIKVGDRRFYRIGSISDMPYEGPVHDMRVDDELGTHRFVANTIVVSNCQFWTENEPRVSAAIDFYSDFPVSAGFELECPNAAVKEFFEKLCKKLKLEEKLPRILREYFGMGDAFVMLNLDCQKCGGEGLDENGEECEHEGAIWSHLSVLDPTMIEVMPFSHLTDEPEIYMLPNNELAKIVSTGKPEHLYERLSEGTKRQVKSRRPMKLDPLVVTHFKHGASDYQVYGKSIIRRLFPTLAYKDKLRQANWLIAERHAVPIKIVKIGSDTRPASQEDIWDVQERLSEVANDPLLTFVTHHAFDYEWVGACHDYDGTEVLTKDGFKHYWEIKNTDLLANYNNATKTVEFLPYEERYEYDYDSSKYGGMVKVSGRNFDVMVTPNHMMWAKRKGEWQKIRADEIKNNDAFLMEVDGWQGSIPEKLPFSKIEELKGADLNDYLRLAGYYLSEGSVQKDIRYKNGCSALYIYQNKDTLTYTNIVDVINRTASCGLGGIYDDDRRDQNHHDSVNSSIRIYNTSVAGHFSEQFGHLSANKFIPRWIVDLPRENLEVLVESMMEGDGYTRSSVNGRIRYKYTTTSKQMADNLQEILFRIGWKSTVSKDDDEDENHRLKYRIYWTKTRRETSSVNVAKNVERIDYHGKVFCFTVPTGLFVTRRNGKIGIHGNSGKVLQLTSEFELIENEMIDGFGLSKAILSGEGPTYANAQIGVEVIARRLEGVQRMIGEWLSEKVFKPVAKFNGFVTKGARGETEFIYPEIKFNDLRLRDDQAKVTNMWNSRQAGEISARTWIEKGLDLDMDTEIENMRQEDMAAIIASPDLNLASGGVSGQGYGADPAMGGGGMPGMDMGGGGMPPPPGGEMGGEPPMGGEGAPPGGEMGGAMPTAASLEGNYRKVFGEVSEIRSRVISAAKLDDNEWMFRTGSKGRISVGDAIDRGAIVLGQGYRGPLESEPDMGTLYEAVTPYWGRAGMTYLDFLLQSSTVGDIREQILERYIKLSAKEDKKRLPTAREFFTRLENQLISGVASMKMPYQMWLSGW